MERIADKQMLMELGTKVRLVGSKKKNENMSITQCLLSSNKISLRGWI